MFICVIFVMSLNYINKKRRKETQITTVAFMPLVPVESRPGRMFRTRRDTHSVCDPAAHWHTLGVWLYGCHPRLTSLYAKGTGTEKPGSKI